MSPKLTPDQRRALILSALSDVPVLQLTKEYDVSRSWIYVLLEEARKEPREKLAEAMAEVEFRERVLEKV